jgi:MarR family transcriptional regulator, transcriptional regulator for hemolysin
MAPHYRHRRAGSPSADTGNFSDVTLPDVARTDGSHELDTPPWLRVDATIMATARAIREAYDERLSAIGLNLSQASLLAFVAEFGSHSQSGLAARLNLVRAATGQLVDALEQRGLVERAADPEDRRVWLVDITPAGRAVAAHVSEIDQALRARLRQGISKADRQHLARLLLQLEANLAG